MSKKTQATSLLCLMVVGFIFTYNRENFWLILLNHGFLAAVIGGLADWFAITALFRKPLGFISFRTEVLPRNRERIMNELVDFIGKDLLNPQYVINNIKMYDLSNMVVNYCNNLGGRTRLKFALRELMGQFFSSLDTHNVAYSLSSALKRRRENFNMARILIQFMLSFLQTENGDKFLDSVIKSCRNVIPDLLKTDFIQKLLAENVETIKKRYARDKQMRELMFEVVNFTGENLNKKLLKFVDEYSTKLLDYDSKERSKLKQFLANKIELLGKRDGYKLKVSQWEHYFFVKKFDFSDNLVDLIENFCKNEKNQAELIQELENLIDSVLDDLTNDKQKQHRLNEYLISKLTNFIQNNFSWVLKYIREELMKRSNEEFVELVESRVGKDLQMIRINGSIVGGAAGMGLYVISFLVERMCNL